MGHCLLAFVSALPPVTGRMVRHAFCNLRAMGETCSVNRVARLMQAAGIKARHKRRRVPGQLVSPVHSVAPNLLDRQLQASNLIRNGRPTSVCRSKRRKR